DRLVRYEEAGDRALASLGLDRELSGEPVNRAAHNPTFEERSEFWSKLRQALLPMPDAYAAGSKLLADRVKATIGEQQAPKRQNGVESTIATTGSPEAIGQEFEAQATTGAQDMLRPETNLEGNGIVRHRGAGGQEQ